MNNKGTVAQRVRKTSMSNGQPSSAARTQDAKLNGASFITSTTRMDGSVFEDWNSVTPFWVRSSEASDEPNTGTYQPI